MTDRAKFCTECGSLGCKGVWPKCTAAVKPEHVERLKCSGGCGVESGDGYDTRAPVPYWLCEKTECHRKYGELQEKECMFCGALPGYAHTGYACDGKPKLSCYCGKSWTPRTPGLTGYACGPNCQPPVKLHDSCSSGYALPKEIAEGMKKFLGNGRQSVSAPIHFELESLDAKGFEEALKRNGPKLKEMLRGLPNRMRANERGIGIAALDLRPKAPDYSGWRTEEDNLPDET